MTSQPIHTPRARRLAVAAETLAILAMGLWLGGMVALGAFSAPTIFGMLDRESAGQVMGTIFARFDRMVLVLVGVFAVAEAVRAFLDRSPGRSPGMLGRLRLVIAAVLVILALVSALWLGPSINELFHQGVRRGVGQAGAHMDRLHHFAELLGKTAVFLGALWIGLGVLARRQAAPRPPGTQPPGSN